MRRTALLLVVLLAAGPADAASSSPDRPGPWHRFPIVRKGEPGLPGHTILRPRKLSAVRYRLPVVLWANGGCRTSNEEYHYFLTHLAAYGYLVIANGAPENPYRPGELGGLVSPDPQKVLDALRWVLRESARRGSAYYGKVDTSRIVAMGQSCGAWEALAASSSDNRIRSVVAWNNGGDPHSGDTNDVSVPTLFVSGGTQDYTLADTTLGYARMRQGVPAVHADNANAGHTGFWDDPHTPMQDQPFPVAQNWLSLVLYNDVTARHYFLATPCGLCRQPHWTVESKGWS